MENLQLLLTLLAVGSAVAFDTHTHRHVHDAGLEFIRVKPENATSSAAGKAPPLLFVHGAWHRAACWERNYMPFFAEHGYDTWAVSLRGHGKSSLRGTKIMNLITCQDYLQDVVDAIEHVVETTGKKPVLIGHSMGGFLVDMYLEKEQNISAAILLGAVPPGGCLHTLLKIFKNAPLQSMWSILNLSPGWLMSDARTVKWAMLSDKADDKLAVDIKEEYFGDESVMAVLGMVFPKIQKGNHGNVPLLAVAAENDNFVTIKQVRTHADKYGADFKMIKGVAHDMMVDLEWERSAVALLDWIRAKV